MKARFLWAATLLFCFTGASGLHADGILRIPLANQHDELLPLTAVVVGIEIHDQVAITTVRNSFFYDGEDTVRAMYHYRLPPEASVTGFGVWRDEELIEYELRPGEQGGPGGGIGDNPDLREYLGTNPFSTPLDSIYPGVNMIYLRYVELLPYDFGSVQLDYPLNCGEFVVGPIDTILISVAIDAQRTIDDLEILTYEDLTEYNCPDDNHAIIVFRNYDVEPAEDWSFTIQYSQEDIGAWLFAHRSDPERSGYFILIIEPGLVDTGEAVTKYFTFVLDRSGSMFGSKIRQARQAVLDCLDHLLPRDFFNIIDFASDVRALDNEMLRANEGNLNAARNYVNRINADGLTNIYGALMQAVSMNMGEGNANQIIFTTDGIPTAGESTDESVILRDVTEANRFNARIFSFGIGDDVNRQFLAALSEANRGISIFFDPEEARIDSIINNFYQYFYLPTLVNPVVTIPEEIETDSLYPPELQDVAAGKQLYLFGRYSTFGEVDIELSGRTCNGDTTLVFEEMQFPEDEEGNGFVPRMWAKAVIDYWLRWMLIHGEDQDIIDLIIELSLEYGILTPYTEYGNPDEPPDEAVERPCITRFDAEPTPDGLLISWSVSGVACATSFNIYRSSSRNGRYTRLNDAPLVSTTYLDGAIRDDATAFYKIEVLFGESRWMSEPFTVGRLPVEMTLSGPFPNPFNDRTRIEYSIPADGTVRIELFDLEGRIVHQVFAGYRRAGTHVAVINAENMAAGGYIVKISHNEDELTRPVMLIR